MFTNRLIRAGEELLWNYPPTDCDPYVKFDVFARPRYQSEMFSSIRAMADAYRHVPFQGATGGGPAVAVNAVIPMVPNAPAIKTASQAKGNKNSGTPLTAPRAKVAAIAAGPRGGPAAKRFVPEGNPYGNPGQGFQESSNHVGEHSEDLDNSDGGSGSSSESVDSEVPEGYVNEPQPFYTDYVFPIVDVKRKIQLNWEVKNEISSDIACQPYTGCTKLHWRAIGLNGLARRKTESEFFLLMDVPITSIAEGQSILSMTNESVGRDARKRGGDFSK